MYVGGEAEVGGAAGGMQAGAWRDVEERERQELTQTGVHEQGRITRDYEPGKGQRWCLPVAWGRRVWWRSFSLRAPRPSRLMR